MTAKGVLTTMAGIAAVLFAGWILMPADKQVAREGTYLGIDVNSYEIGIAHYATRDCLEGQAAIKKLGNDSWQLFSITIGDQNRLNAHVYRTIESDTNLVRIDDVCVVLPSSVGMPKSVRIGQDGKLIPAD